MNRFSCLFLLPLSLLLGACTQIDTGNVGVERVWGQVKAEELPQGVYITLFKSVDEFTTKEVAVSLNDLRPKSRDNLTMSDVDMDIYFKVDPTKVADLFIKYQGDVSKLPNGDRIVAHNRMVREAREAVYKATAEFDATTMHSKRTELAERIRGLLQAELDKSDKAAFVITNVNVKSLVTDPAIEQSIRNRAAVDQQIEAARKEVELARATAEKAIVAAEGQAKANRILSDSITPQLLRLREIEAQQAIATKEGNTTILLPHGTTPLVNIK